MIIGVGACVGFLVGPRYQNYPMFSKLKVSFPTFLAGILLFHFTCLISQNILQILAWKKEYHLHYVINLFIDPASLLNKQYQGWSTDALRSLLGEVT